MAVKKFDVAHCTRYRRYFGLLCFDLTLFGRDFLFFYLAGYKTILNFDEAQLLIGVSFIVCSKTMNKFQYCLFIIFEVLDIFFNLM